MNIMTETRQSISTTLLKTNTRHSYSTILVQALVLQVSAASPKPLEADWLTSRVAVQHLSLWSKPKSLVVQNLRVRGWGVETGGGGKGMGKREPKDFLCIIQHKGKEQMPTHSGPFIHWLRHSIVQISTKVKSCGPFSHVADISF